MDNVFGKTMSGSRSLYVDDLTIGTVSITRQYATVPYQLQLPPAQGIPNSFLTNNGSGLLTWRDETTLPYIEEVGISAPSFLTVTNSPITPTSLSPTMGITYSGSALPTFAGGTGLTTVGTAGKVLQSNGTAIGWSEITGTEKVVLWRSPTFADDITVPMIKGGGIDGSLDITTGLNTSAILNIQTANIIGLTAPAIYIGPTRYPSTTGTAGQYLRTGPPASGFATAAWTTIPISETTGTLPATRGGTGLTTVGANGEYLASNGTSLYWEAGHQIGSMRYKQKYFPYIYVSPPVGMQLWYEFQTLDMRTLEPVAGEQIGLALTYGGEAGFGRFTNDYDFPVIATISYSVSRYLPLAILVDNISLDSYLAAVATALNGTTLAWLEKNGNGDHVGAAAAPSGGLCSTAYTMILEPGDFFQIRALNQSPTVSVFNVESEMTVSLRSYGSTAAVYAPSSPGSGTVTSVNIASADAFFAVGGGPITTNGTLSVGLSGEALPTTVGGTGITTVGTSGQVLTSNGTTLSWTTPSPPGTGTVTSVSASAPLASSGGATPTISISSSTGTGSVVLSASPTFTTNLSTPQITGSGTSGNLAITSTGAINATSDGWIYLNTNLSLGSAPVGSIRGFAFGWNNSGEQGENILTYYTGAGLNPRLDICSWNGTTRTTRLTIDNSGALNIPTLKGSGTSGDLSVTSTRNIDLSTPTGTLYLNANGFPSGNGTGGQVLTSNGGGLVVWRTPEKRQYGGYYGGNGATFAASTDTTYKGASSFGTTSLFTTGLSYNTSNGNWTNISASSLLVTATYSFNLTVAVGSGSCYYFTRLNGVVDAAQNLVGARDNATGTATFIVAPGNFFGFYARHTGFPCDFEPGSNIDIIWTTV